MPELAPLQGYDPPDVTYVEDRFSFPLPGNRILYTVPQGRSARVRTVYLELNIVSAAPPPAVILELTDSTSTPYAIIPAVDNQPTLTTWVYTWSCEVGTAFAINGATDFGERYLAMPLPLVVLPNGGRVRLASDADTTFVQAFRMQYELDVGSLVGGGGGAYPLWLQPVT